MGSYIPQHSIYIYLPICHFFSVPRSGELYFNIYSCQFLCIMFIVVLDMGNQSPTQGIQSLTQGHQLMLVCPLTTLLRVRILRMETLVERLRMFPQAQLPQLPGVSSLDLSHVDLALVEELHWLKLEANPMGLLQLQFQQGLHYQMILQCQNCLLV